MGWQPSASKTELLLLCPRPFEPSLEPAPDLPGEPALYGSAFHQIIGECLRTSSQKPLEKSAKYTKVVDKAARQYDMRDFAAELAGHVKSSVKVLRNWLKKEGLQVLEVEKAYSIWPRQDGTHTVREIAPHDTNHVYKTAPGEMPGTVDLIAANKERTRVVVVDHKTGYFESWIAQDENVKFALPRTVPQLRTLGLIVPEALKKWRARATTEVGIFHADRQGLPVVYSEAYEQDDRERHAKALHEAFGLLGKGFMRPGEYCKRCPARIGCPAQAAHALVQSSAQLLETANRLVVEPPDPKALYVLPTEDAEPGLLETRAGALYDLIKRFTELAEHGRTELRRLVNAGAIIETRDGRTLSVRRQTYETLSKKSVIEALGREKGEKELARMRKKGLIKEAEREMLIAEK